MQKYNVGDVLSVQIREYPQHIMQATLIACEICPCGYDVRIVYDTEFILQVRDENMFLAARMRLYPERGQPLTTIEVVGEELDNYLILDSNEASSYMG